MPLAFGVSLFAAGLVFVYVGSARLMDAATVASSALAGLGLIACWKRLDAGSIAPAAAVLLSGLLLIGQQETFSEAPWFAFLLVALSPLAPAATGWLVSWPPLRLMAMRLVLVLLPLAAALLLVRLAVGPLEFE